MWIYIDLESIFLKKKFAKNRRKVCYKKRKKMGKKLKREVKLGIRGVKLEIRSTLSFSPTEPKHIIFNVFRCFQ